MALYVNALPKQNKQSKYKQINKQKQKTQYKTKQTNKQKITTTTKTKQIKTNWNNGKKKQPKSN